MSEYCNTGNYSGNNNLQDVLEEEKRQLLHRISIIESQLKFSQMNDVVPENLALLIQEKQLTEDGDTLAAAGSQPQTSNFNVIHPSKDVTICSLPQEDHIVSFNHTNNLALPVKERQLKEDKDTLSVAAYQPQTSNVNGIHTSKDITICGLPEDYNVSYNHNHNNHNNSGLNSFRSETYNDNWSPIYPRNKDNNLGSHFIGVEETIDQDRSVSGVCQTSPQHIQTYNYQLVPQTVTNVAPVQHDPRHNGVNTIIVTTEPRQISWLIPAILVCLCCFWPTGLCAISAAQNANTAISMGDMETAKDEELAAKVLTFLSLALGTVCIILAMLFNLGFL